MAKSTNKSPIKGTLAREVLSYTVNFIPADEGGYTVEVPALPGCITEGDTFEEAERHARDAILLYLESLIADNEPIPQEENIILGRVSVPIKLLRI